MDSQNLTFSLKYLAHPNIKWKLMTLSRFKGGIRYGFKKKV
jgi:hypothetical protein